MKSFRHLILLSLISCTLAGCNGNKKEAIFGNFKYFENGSINENTLYIDGDETLIRNLLDTGIPFIVYLTKNGCSYCDDFAPIMKDYCLDKKPLVIKLDSDNISDLNSNLNHIFERNYNGRQTILSPSIEIIRSVSDTTFVDNSKYMQTKSAFTRYMNKNFNVKDIYYTQESPITNNYSKTYTYVSFDDSNKDLYIEKVLPLIKKTNKRIVINNGNEVGISVSNISVNNENKNYLASSVSIDNETNQSSFENYF